MMKFNEKYNHEDFLGFITSFLPEDFVEKEEDIVINRNRYKEITTAKILGFSKSLDVHVMEMDHGRENDPRIAIATDAFKILADHWIHKALVIFKNKESDNYRFSYLTISLDLNEKNKAVKKYSNARRYSFYLGTDAKIRTPEQQLLKKGKVKDVDDLLSRFSVEVVNKQFYLEVAKHFDELVKSDGENLMLPGVSQENLNIRKSFAVRLIGRLMFCWFLKQKKSESGQLIPDGLLSSKVVKDNYYHDTLEPLFFGALNTNIDSRDIRSDLFDKVPYLNGGLFSPQMDDYYELDRGTFTSRHINTLKISDSWFKNFFELLETYNFTIDENTVFDQELSVDPEMLGRIFENLLAEINPETGSSERKRTGSFYTPRQIVEYMVDQSLLEYLKTKTKIDEKKLSAMISYDLTDDAEYPLKVEEKKEIISAIESLKILDPACGSGAYPIGALQKIVYILQQIDPDCKLWLEKKLNGVPELYKHKIINEVKSNPFNYTRKLDVIKNSIFGVDIQPIAVDVSRLRCFLTLVVESEVDDSKPNRGIEPLPNLDFKFVCANTLIGLPISKDPTTINAFEDHSGISELSKIMSEYFSCNSQRKNEIRLKFSKTQNDILSRSIFAFGKHTGELTQALTQWSPFSNSSNSWFDPQWMFGLEEKFDVVIGNPPYVNIFNIKDKDYRDYIKEKYSVYKNKTDLYAFFIQRGFDLMKDKGTLYFIISNSWLGTDSFSRLREFLIEKTKVVRLIKCYSDVFEASVTTVILGIKKEHVVDNAVLLSEFNGAFKDIDHKLSYDQIRAQPSLGFTFDVPLIIKVKTKPLGDLCDFSLGIKTSDDKRFIHDGKVDDEHLPLLRGKDVAPYSIKYANKYIWYRPDLMMEKVGAGPRNKAVFEQKNKIIIKDVASNISATLDTNGYFTTDTLNIVYNPRDNYSLEFILGIINSSFIKKWFKISFPAGLHIKLNQLKLIPIPVTNEIGKLESLVNKIIEMKKSDAKTTIQDLENQIDELVYKLYGLNEDEIKVIETKK